jgi:hypothetical protein
MQGFYSQLYPASCCMGQDGCYAILDLAAGFNQRLVRIGPTDQNNQRGPQLSRFIDDAPILIDRLLPFDPAVGWKKSTPANGGDLQASLSQLPTSC